MTRVDSQVPSSKQLAEILLGLLNRNGFPTARIEIVRRVPNDYASSYPTEMVDCRLPDGRTLELFCKYSTYWNEKEYSHRRDVAYEGHVYETVVRHTELSKPLFYGIHCDPDLTVLVIEHLHSAQRISKIEPQVSMLSAARWIGKFHNLNETMAGGSNFTSLIAYNRAYYIGWVDRTLKFTDEITKTRHYPWLEHLCDSFRNHIDLLVEIPPTVIHGEYYGKNILFQNNNIYPIDWQSAAIACGEIDLASLTEWWTDEVESECMEEYKRARWPCGTPDHFDLAFYLSKLYWQFRWLGDSTSQKNDERIALRFETLFSLGKRMGLI